MMGVGPSLRMSTRRRVRALVFLFMLATAAMPAIDAWLHAGADVASVEHSGASDCVVCRVAATRWAPPVESEARLAEVTSAERSHFVSAGTQRLGAPARLMPPTRAPPTPFSVSMF